ncbi:MAG: flagellar biosynthetic protein FliQ [Planctomycetota bacterium]
MDSSAVLQLAASVLLLAAKISAPLLLAALGIGLLVSVFQAVTHINDSTLGFLPRLIGVAAAMYVCLPWILQQLVAFTSQTFQMMERMGQ